MTLPPNRVWRLRLRGVNAYLVDADVLTLVDAGTPWDAKRIRSRLEDVGFEASDIERVLLTHFDLDHVGALADLGPDLDATVHVADPDGQFLTGTAQPPMTNHKGALQRLLGAFLTRPDLPVEVVEDGDEVGPFEAVRTPGHTPGHTSFLHEGFDVAFAGDVVREIDGELKPTSWVMCYDAGQNRRSVGRLADRALRLDVVAPGHGNPLRGEAGDSLRRLADRL
ncbi:MBL fold metallo-hydrolase [Halobium salinum]|uniref:MBL fold metallo-hydrolase n=1 Tax=Halobium salinum TaxID=1364940 RepID=A0ABD5PH72_9EURY|nr:MBL fold metallo-hydrolase [Halobium salinum]